MNSALRLQGPRGASAAYAMVLWTMAATSAGLTTGKRPMARSGRRSSPSTRTK